MFEHGTARYRLTGASAICAPLVATLLVAAGVLAPTGCSPRDSGPSSGTADAPRLDTIAEAYVKLGLALGNHDPDYVDAYLGPAEWRDAAERSRPSLSEIRDRAAELIEVLGAEFASDTDEMIRLRQRALRKNLEALAARVEMLDGREFSFDAESLALFDAVAPVKSEPEFQRILDELAQLLPGEGTLLDRYEAFRKQFEIPPDRLDAVFRRAIAECRARTTRFIALPAQESFELEYVRDKPWNAYNWYEGDYHSLIQLNTSLPIYIGDAVDLACHEGYPGHHVNNILWERDLLRGRGWVEFSLYPLFGPQSLINEGSAEYGIRMAFPGNERSAFERDELFPLAGLDPTRADAYHRVRDLVAELDYVRNEAARRYLDGEFDEQQTIDWLARYALVPAPRAARNVQFIERYRSYVINYNLGKDLVRHYIDTTAGTDDSAERRWQIFEHLLATPLLPSDLAAADRSGNSGWPER